jgi:hypothetical protein
MNLKKVVIYHEDRYLHNSSSRQGLPESSLKSAWRADSYLNCAIPVIAAPSLITGHHFSFHNFCISRHIKEAVQAISSMPVSASNPAKNRISPVGSLSPNQAMYSREGKITTIHKAVIEISWCGHRHLPQRLMSSHGFSHE